MLVLNEEERMLADSAKEFIQDLSPIAAQRELRDNPNADKFDQNVWQQVIEMGWPAMPFAEEYEGFDFSAKGLAVIFEQLGSNLCALPMLSSVVLAGGLIERHATQEHKKELLPSIISGQLRLAVALDEGAHHNPANIQTTFEETEAGYTVSGTKTMVIDANGADGFVVVARAKDSDAYRLFYLASDTSNINLSARELIDSRNYAQVSLADVNVAKSALLSSAELSLDDLQQSLDVARCCVAAEILGACQNLFDTTVEYLKTRVQFAAPIGSFQALQHRAAWLYSELEVARSCVLHAAESIDKAKAEQLSPEKLAKAVSLAMYKVSVMADKVSSEAVQMHGGIGVTDELDIGLLLKRVRVAQAILGDRAYHQQRYAQIVL
ncbi:acyl-CoA dehydrogenase family protein [Thalassotalea maritima]|uniref:acyl-CoA dehydrogenase family protein n=1 Tax=Thalassotalea maritima TaxID=3242416 RepID=UPI0035272C7D